MSIHQSNLSVSVCPEKFYFTLLLNLYLAEDNDSEFSCNCRYDPMVSDFFCCWEVMIPFYFTSLFSVATSDHLIVFVALKFCCCVSWYRFLSHILFGVCGLPEYEDPTPPFFLSEFDSHVELTLSLMHVSFLSIFFIFISRRSILHISSHLFSVHEFLSCVFLTCPWVSSFNYIFLLSKVILGSFKYA